MTAARPLALVRPDDRHHRRERKARYLQRLRSGRAVALVEYDIDEMVSLLLDLGWLDLDKSEDRFEVGAALGRMIADAARAHRNR